MIFCFIALVDKRRRNNFQYIAIHIPPATLLTQKQQLRSCWRIGPARHAKRATELHSGMVRIGEMMGAHFQPQPFGGRVQPAVRAGAGARSAR